MDPYPQRLIEYRDAIREGAPLTGLMGLSLDFVTRVVAAPMALFSVVDQSLKNRPTVIKADPVLTGDPVLLGREYLDSIADLDPIKASADGGGLVVLAGTEHLKRAVGFTDSAFASSFLAGHSLGPVLIMFLRDGDPDPCCMVMLVRSLDEPEFNEREKGFLRHVAPLLIHSYGLALDLRSSLSLSGNRLLDDLTPREKEIARLAAGGSRNDQIASDLHVTPGTVKTHLRNIYSKLGVDSRVHLSLMLSGLEKPSQN